MSLPIVAGISLEATRVVTDIFFPQYLNTTQSKFNSPTQWIGYHSLGAFMATTLLSQLSFHPLMLAPLSFLSIGIFYAALSISSPQSITVFFILVTCIGAATTTASVSSSALVKNVKEGRNYRLAGIASKLAVPLLIVVVNNKVSFLFLTIAATMVCTACIFIWSSGSVVESVTILSTATTTSSNATISRQHWVRIILYCIIVSFPNIAGGLIRSLLHTKFHDTAIESVAFAHTSSQVLSFGFIFCTTFILDKPKSAWITVTIQAFVMSIAAFVILISNSKSTTAIIAIFTLFRSVEESAKLPNSMILLMEATKYCTNKATASTAAVRFVATQKLIGSILKILFSAVSSHVIFLHGTSAGLAIATLICLIGAVGLACMCFEKDFFFL